ncbi:efflux RND transporter periplasmic adaptor subunit [Paenibacillus lentus]|uniref:Efflux RND transporter periplasmic adaptor subunit n=1 Tax=Paenibacillus lentus TaxID=1338368 RepID=A0A3S8RPD3_9BACL|nr:efflux RND transporter periplasmic adaptor subunit [Paenibacillus lentus]
MFKKKWFWGAILGLTIIVLVLANLTNMNRAVAVEMTEVFEGLITEQIYTSGKLEAGKSTDIYSPTSGVVEKVEVKQGDTIKKGQVLMTLQIDDVKEQIEKERLNLELIETERMNAKKQHFDMFKEKMLEDPSVEVEELDLTSFDLRIQTSKLMIASLEKKLNNHVVYAEEEGVLTQVLVDPGQMIAEGSQIATIVDLSAFKVKANLNELDAGKVYEGMQAIVTGDSITESYEGEVTYMSPIAILVDQTSKDASVEMTVELSRISPELRPGYNVTIELEVPDKERLLVPLTAVQYEGEQSFVFKIQDGVAVKTEVQTGKENEEYIEIVSGAAKGESVVLEGANQLKDGDKVKLP